MSFALGSGACLLRLRLWSECLLPCWVGGALKLRYFFSPPQGHSWPLPGRTISHSMLSVLCCLSISLAFSGSTTLPMRLPASLVLLLLLSLGSSLLSSPVSLEASVACTWGFSSGGLSSLSALSLPLFTKGQTDRQRQTDRGRGRHTDIQADADRQAGRQTDRHTDRQSVRQTGRQTARHTD